MNLTKPSLLTMFGSRLRPLLRWCQMHHLLVVSQTCANQITTKSVGCSFLDKYTVLQIVSRPMMMYMIIGTLAALLALTSAQISDVCIDCIAKV